MCRKARSSVKAYAYLATFIGGISKDNTNVMSLNDHGRKILLRWISS